MKISINLLPSEVTSSLKEQVKIYKIRLFGIATILFLIFLASLTVALQILQSSTFHKVQRSLQGIEQKVTAYKGKEASLTVLKNRLTTISKLTSAPSRQRTIYSLVNSIIPSSFIVSSLSVDSSGILILSAVTGDGNSIDKFLADLASPEKTEGQIAGTDIENLSRGRDGFYRLILKIRSK